MADAASNTNPYDALGWWRGYLDQQMKSWSQIMSAAQPPPTPDEALRRSALSSYTTGLQTWRQLLDLTFAGYESFLNTALAGRVPGTAVGTETAALESWRQMADQAFNGYFSFLNSLAQNLPAGAFPTIPLGVSGDEATKALKRFTDESIEHWSKPLEQAVNAEDFAQNIGRYLDQMLNQVGLTQRYLDATTERTWRALNLPSRQQIVRLAEQLKVLEMRLETLEDRLAPVPRGNGRQAEPSPTPGAPPTSRARRKRP